MTGVQFPAGTMRGFFSVRHRDQKDSGTNPASYPMGTGALTSIVNRPERETYHSPPFGAEVKNAWNYTYVPPIRVHGVFRN
jgi:hypothetical protein